jgi:hypothetical protein
MSEIYAGRLFNGKLIKVGSPHKFENPQQMLDSIEEYLDMIENSGSSYFTKSGEMRWIDKKFVTLPGLARFLGFNSTEAFMRYAYSENTEMKHVVRTAITYIEDFLQQKLIDPDFKPQGVIFLLKQLGYKDESSLSIDIQQQATVDPVTGERNVTPIGAGKRQITIKFIKSENAMSKEDVEKHLQAMSGSVDGEVEVVQKDEPREALPPPEPVGSSEHDQGVPNIMQDTRNEIDVQKSIQERAKQLLNQKAENNGNNDY